MCKARDDAAKKIEAMRKDCDARVKDNEIKSLSKDFSELKGNMEKLIKQRAGDNEHSRLSD